MDKRSIAFGFICLLCIIYLMRNRLMAVVVKSGGIDFLPSSVETVELPSVEVPRIPGFKPGPALWTQTTGLMCACDDKIYSAPVVVQEITIPAPPVPRFVYQPEPVQEIAQQPPMTYTTFGMDSSFAIWGDRSPEQVYRGSDGRIFLRPKYDIWGKPQPNVSNNPLFIGTDEYSMDADGTIHYGPYTYKPMQLGFLGSAGM